MTAYNLRSYQYGDSLPIGSIRVLGLLPGKPGATIRCTLETRVLEEAEDSYEAISYCWGAQTEQIAIYCNSRRLLVGRNLFDALCQFRDLKHIRYLWADAICINQQDDTEKGHQVKRMGSVYAKASRVLVWLGRDDDQIAEDCFALLRETVDYLDGQFVSSGDNLYFPIDRATCPISTDQKRWDKVRAFLDLSWFERAWVVQESGLGKDCILHWGGHVIPLIDVYEFVLFYYWRSDLRPFVGSIPSSNVNRMINLVDCNVNCFDNTRTWLTSRPLLRWRAARYPPVNSILGAILASQDLKTTDKRDHVYAFLGSPSARRSDGELIVEPVYHNKKSAEDVFVDVAKALLSIETEAPSVLLYINISYEEHLQAISLPSWVPRWDLCKYPEMLARNWYRAGGEPDLFKAEIYEPTRQLSIKGIVFDHLSWTSEIIEARNFSMDPADWTRPGSNRALVDELWNDLIAIACRADNEFHDMFLPTMMQEHISFLNMEDVHANYRTYRTCMRELIEGNANTGQLREDGNPWEILTRLKHLDGQKLVLTTGGRLGVAPAFSKQGDLCCVAVGVDMPLIIRPSKLGPSVYNLVGASYINGAMKGEVLEKVQNGDLKTETITIA